MSYVPKSEVELGIGDASSVSPGFFKKIMNYKIGILPLPAFLVIACIVISASYVQIMKEGKAVSALPADMLGGFAIIMVFGWALGEIGGKIPVLKDIGGPAILSLFIPSAMLAYGWFNPSMKAATVAMPKPRN